MKEKKSPREQAFENLVDLIVRMGFPREFGAAIASSLGTEKTMSRMTGYLLKAKPRTPEEIADEMLVIVADRDRWVEKKKNEYYQQKYNEYLYSRRLEQDESE